MSSSALYSKYKCDLCHRDYARKSYLDKHRLLCEFLSKSVKDHKLEIQEEDDTPSQRKLYEIILELSSKIVKMEEKIVELSKVAETKRKKINIIEWLNNCYKININFEQWLQNIKINRKHLEKIFDNDYTTGLCYIINELVEPGKLDNNNNEIIIPLKAIDQKKNIIYIYNNEEQGWSIMSNELLQRLSGTLTKLIIGEFIKWQHENADKIEHDDRIGLICAQYMKKIMGSNLSCDQINNKIRSEIYKLIKVNLKTIIEYEFE